jgi:5'(3')-deoxyribonucleotidase
MKEKTRLVIDVDGVIYNFVSAFMKLYVYHQGTVPADFEWNNWDDMDKLPNQDVVDHLWKREVQLMSYGKPYDQSIQALQCLNETYDVVLSTAVPFVHWKARADWFEKWAPFIHRKNQLIITNDKTKVVGDLLIEDKLETVKDWCELNGSHTAFCIDRPWNREKPPWSYTRVPSLRYIAEILGVWK